MAPENGAWFTLSEGNVAPGDGGATLGSEITELLAEKVYVYTPPPKVEKANRSVIQILQCH